MKERKKSSNRKVDKSNVSKRKMVAEPSEDQSEDDIEDDSELEESDFEVLLKLLFPVENIMIEI